MNTSAALIPQYTAADTVAALHKIYRTRRAGGFTLLGLGALALEVSPIVAAQFPSNYNSYGSLYNFAGGLGIGLVISIPLMIVGGNTLLNHSRKIEKLNIALYQETNVLPSKIEKELVSARLLPLK
ncbi:hypothetical protein ACFP2F_22195 [Hymenobacter artigasi]|uniref:Uncharacterized protein n=1 Tax=Hymenobacter artigasi TaxID=2719616 RepID=A0ABX1HMH4_9BACT|nr:hypothetical protein [Hymenobacter artigasi]NKI90038.1 hypothetical protein [Hymenobacter artigasi]